ncbi:MAG: hypothetical protein ACRDNS_16550, partial [Trebonia sp.]
SGHWFDPSSAHQRISVLQIRRRSLDWKRAHTSHVWRWLGRLSSALGISLDVHIAPDSMIVRRA